MLQISRDQSLLSSACCQLTYKDSESHDCNRPHLRKQTHTWHNKRDALNSVLSWSVLTHTSTRWSFCRWWMWSNQASLMNCWNTDLISVIGLQVTHCQRPWSGLWQLFPVSIIVRPIVENISTHWSHSIASDIHPCTPPDCQWRRITWSDDRSPPHYRQL